MKFTALAVVILALGMGIALGFVLGSGVFEAEAKRGKPVQLTTNREFLQGGGTLSLADTDDGTVIASYTGFMSLVTSNCDGTRAWLFGAFSRDFLLIDTITGQVLATYSPPPLENGAVTAFSCVSSDLDALNAGVQVVGNRGVVAFHDGSEWMTQLIETETGAVIASYSGFPKSFNCVGDRLHVNGTGLVDTVTGAVVAPTAATQITFVCAGPRAS